MIVEIPFEARANADGEYEGVQSADSPHELLEMHTRPSVIPSSLLIRNEKVKLNSIRIPLILQ